MQGGKVVPERKKATKAEADEMSFLEGLPLAWFSDTDDYREAVYKQAKVLQVSWKREDVPDPDKEVENQEHGDAATAYILKHKDTLVMLQVSGLVMDCMYSIVYNAVVGDEDELDIKSFARLLFEVLFQFSSGDWNAFFIRGLVIVVLTHVRWPANAHTILKVAAAWKEMDEHLIGFMTEEAGAMDKNLLKRWILASTVKATRPLLGRMIFENHWATGLGVAAYNPMVMIEEAVMLQVDVDDALAELKEQPQSHRDFRKKIKQMTSDHNNQLNQLKAELQRKGDKLGKMMKKANKNKEKQGKAKAKQDGEITELQSKLRAAYKTSGDKDTAIKNLNRRLSAADAGSKELKQEAELHKQKAQKANSLKDKAETRALTLQAELKSTRAQLQEQAGLKQQYEQQVEKMEKEKGGLAKERKVNSALMTLIVGGAKACKVYSKAMTYMDDINKSVPPILDDLRVHGEGGRASLIELALAGYKKVEECLSEHPRNVVPAKDLARATAYLYDVFKDELDLSSDDEDEDSDVITSGDAERKDKDREWTALKVMHKIAGWVEQAPGLKMDATPSISNIISSPMPKTEELENKKRRYIQLDPSTSTSTSTDVDDESKASKRRKINETEDSPMKVEVKARQSDARLQLETMTRKLIAEKKLTKIANYTLLRQPLVAGGKQTTQQWLKAIEAQPVMASGPMRMELTENSPLRCSLEAALAIDEQTPMNDQHFAETEMAKMAALLQTGLYFATQGSETAMAVMAYRNPQYGGSDLVLMHNGGSKWWFNGSSIGFKSELSAHDVAHSETFSAFASIISAATGTTIVKIISSALLPNWDSAAPMADELTSKRIGQKQLDMEEGDLALVTTKLGADVEWLAFGGHQSGLPLFVPTQSDGMRAAIMYIRKTDLEGAWVMRGVSNHCRKVRGHEQLIVALLRGNSDIAKQLFHLHPGRAAMSRGPRMMNAHHNTVRPNSAPLSVGMGQTFKDKMQQAMEPSATHSSSQQNLFKNLHQMRDAEKKRAAAKHGNYVQSKHKHKRGGNGGCFGCGEHGHQKRNCPNKNKMFRSPPGNQERRYNGRGGGGGAGGGSGGGGGGGQGRASRY